MGNQLLKLYHALPGPLRTLAASLRGYQLSKWRYGPETDRLVEEALVRDQWSAERWRAWQAERLAFVLHRAATTVPYYREHWAQRRRAGDHASFEELRNWPVLTKDEVRRHARAFIASDCDPRAMFHDHTSGTTGTPLDLWLTRDTVRRWYALHEARARVWHGVSRHDHWGILGGQQVVPFARKQPPFWVWNAGLNQVYFSVAHIAPWSVPSYLEEIRARRLTHLISYSSSLYFLAMEAQGRAERLPLKVVLTNAEPLYDYQRRMISETFGCPVRETYGMGEIVCAASECGHGRLHLWPEAGHLELLDESDQPVPPGEAGRIVGTSLFNTDMPLIRFDTRDRGQLAASGTNCACGRTLPVVERIWGRWDDMVVTRDGRQLVLIDALFDSSHHIKEAQIIQETLDDFTMKIVPAPGWSDADAELLRRALRERVGPVTVNIELAPHIERTWAGKFRVFISKLPHSTPAPK